MRDEYDFIFLCGYLFLLASAIALAIICGVVL